MNTLGKFYDWLLDQGFYPVYDDAGTDDTRNLNWNAIFITVPHYNADNCWHPRNDIESAIKGYTAGAGIDIEWSDDIYETTRDGKATWLLYVSTEPGGGLNEDLQDFVGYNCFAGGKVSGQILPSYEFITSNSARIYTTEAGFANDVMITYDEEKREWNVKPFYTDPKVRHLEQLNAIYSDCLGNAFTNWVERYMKSMLYGLFMDQPRMAIAWDNEVISLGPPNKGSTTP